MLSKIKTADLTGSVSRKSGGLFDALRRLVQSLSETGVESRVFGTSDEFTAEDIAAWEPVHVRAFPPIWPKSFGYSPKFQTALEEFGPHLTHTHGIWMYPSVATNRYSRRHRVPYIISMHGMFDPWAIRNSRWKKVIAHNLFEGAHLRHAHCLRALCESESRSLRQLGLKNPIAVIPNGIDLPPVGPQDHETAGPQDYAGRGLKSDGRKVLLYLGRIHAKKGLVNLLRAWARVQRSDVRGQSSEWMLAIAGWDQAGHEDELKQLATELGISWADARRRQKAECRNSEIEPANSRAGLHALRSVLSAPCSLLFLGPQFGEDKAACYRNCAAFILPSFSEGLPMVVLEAWAYGKPVLMTPECNLPEGFAAGAAMRIETSAESIEQGLLELFRAPHPALRTLGDNGRHLVATRFAWPAIAEEMKQMYLWVLGGGSKPSCMAG